MFTKKRIDAVPTTPEEWTLYYILFLHSWLGRTMTFVSTFGWVNTFAVPVDLGWFNFLLLPAVWIPLAAVGAMLIVFGHVASASLASKVPRITAPDDTPKEWEDLITKITTGPFSSP